ncbi:hypothetical protein [Streptomyces sp. MST-110588]|nr:hypothetical protein [Streptomyces sp. MST-110588]
MSFREGLSVTMTGVGHRVSLAPDPGRQGVAAALTLFGAEASAG